MIMHYHWSSRYGRLGKYVGTIQLKLLDDHQKIHALILPVANGNRACVDINEDHHRTKYWSASMDDGKRLVDMFFNN